MSHLKLVEHNVKQLKHSKLLWITKDDKLNFEERLFELGKKASMQLNTIIHLQEYSGKEQEESIINSLFFKL